MMALFHFDPLVFLSVMLMVICIDLLWYAPFAFGKFWLQIQRNWQPCPPHVGKGTLIMLGTQLGALLVINALENGLGIRDFYGGVILGLVCGLGLVGSFTLSNAFFFGIPLKLWAIDLTHQLWVIALAAGALAALN